MKPILAILCLFAATSPVSGQTEANQASTGGSKPPPVSGAVPAQPAPTPEAVNWEDLYARAETVAQQWENKAKDLERQATAEFAEMDAETRAAARRQQADPLPPAPKPTPAVGDLRSRFYDADARGKAWRARAMVLEIRIRSWQPMLAEARARRAAQAGNSYSSSPSGGSNPSPGGPISVRGYQKSDGTIVQPYQRSAPGTAPSGGKSK